MILITRIIGWEWGWSNKETKKKKHVIFLFGWIQSTVNPQTRC